MSDQTKKDNILLSNINLLSTSLNNLDKTYVNFYLDKIFKEVLYENFDYQDFHDTCIKLFTIIHEFRCQRSMEALYKIYSEIDDPSLYILNLLDNTRDWFSKEFGESLWHVTNNYKLQYSENIRKVIVHIEENYEKDISLETLSEIVGLSRTYLSTLFKKEIKQTVSSYIINYRIKQSKILLKSTNMKIYEVAESVGFNSSQYFSKLFIKLNKLTPIQYREAKRIK